MLPRGVLWALLAVVLIYVLYRLLSLVNKKYNLKIPFLDSFQAHSFQAHSFQARPSPAPVAVTEHVAIPQPQMVVSPAGPNPPNATTPPSQVSRQMLPEERPNDEMASMNSEVPIKDNLRHPERMFNAGPEHSGTKQAVESGIAGETKGAPSPSGKFSPDFAQNGGEFMSGIFANDMTVGDNYAEI